MNNIMSGRLEKEEKVRARIEHKINGQPKIYQSYYTYLRANKIAVSSINVYIDYVLHFMKYVTNGELSDEFYKVSIEDIENYFISLETTTMRDGSIKRVNTDILAARHSGLMKFYNFLVKRGYLEKNLIEQIDRPSTANVEHKVTYLTKQEIKKIMSCIDRNPNIILRTRDRAVVSLGIGTGLRASALAGINLSDIDWDNGTIRVVEKRNKVREIAIGDNTQKIIKEWISCRNTEFPEIDTDALFLSQKKNRLSTDAAADMLHKYVKEAGITKNIGLHKLRSTAATQMAAAGVSIQAIAKQLGHNSIQVTQKYVDVLKDEKEKSLKVLDNLF